MTRTLDLECPNCGVSLGPDIEFEPECPPRPCSNPDDPAFSDPGSPGGLYGLPDRCPVCLIAIDPDEMYEQAAALFRQQDEDAYEDAMLRKYEDWRDRE